MKHNVTNEVLPFECCLFQPIWISQSGDITIFPREFKIPLCHFSLNNTISFVDRHLLINKAYQLCAMLCITFSKKWHNCYLDLSWENNNISRLQHTKWLKYTAFKSQEFFCESNVGFMQQLLFIHFKRGHFVLAQFFLGHPV